ncbi:MAG: methyltransferase domain-containing protein [Alphaproteobacteria bacterium]|nr:methyltransferase domain-containing protein [Alphaproteobacteria bacterium]
MDKIEFYKQLHKSDAEFGTSSPLYYREVCLAIDFLKPKSVLDYGCGKGLLLEQLKKKYPEIFFYGYDPGVEGKDTLPVKTADLVINTDVLEHIPENEIEDVVNQISKISSNVFFGLHHALAGAKLPNGENAHCTVRPTFWYFNLFDRYFKIQTILPFLHYWQDVILTFSVSPSFYNSWYKIVDEEREKLLEKEFNQSLKGYKAEVKLKKQPQRKRVKIGVVIQKLQYKIWKHLDKKLRKKGIIQ